MRRTYEAIRMGSKRRWNSRLKRVRARDKSVVGNENSSFRICLDFLWTCLSRDLRPEQLQTLTVESNMVRLYCIGLITWHLNIPGQPFLDNHHRFGTFSNNLVYTMRSRKLQSRLQAKKRDKWNKDNSTLVVKPLLYAINRWCRKHFHLRQCVSQGMAGSINRA